MAKNIRGFLETLFEYYLLNIIVNVNFSDLNLNITVSTTLKYFYKRALNQKLKFMGGTIKNFEKKLLSDEIFSSLISWATNCLLKSL